MKAIKKPELLAPAGSLIKLKTAFDFGADAVYAGGSDYSLRAFAQNFSVDDFKKGAEYARERGKKLYAALNVYARDSQLGVMATYIRMLKEAGVDAVIVSDPGVFSLVRETEPELPVHISTQANTVNLRACNFWHEQGARRIVLARELTLPEIELISKNTLCETEVFVHGAMCVSYSGRCLLSNYLTGRDGNYGQCAQPCRWEYSLSERSRPHEQMGLSEDKNGTYIFNSRDLCLARRIPELIRAGVHSFKIEGRVKSEFYVATVVGAYRRIIDGYLADPGGYEFDGRLMEELCKISHRPYFEGFLDGITDGQSRDEAGYIREYDYVAYVEGYDEKNMLAMCSQRGKFSLRDELEVLSPAGLPLVFKAEELFDGNMDRIESTPHAMMKFFLRTPRVLPAGSMLRAERRK